MRKIFPAAMLLLLVMPFTAAAHTALTASSPVQGEVLKESPKSIELTFSTAIEEGSSMVLNSSEKQVELSNMSIDGNVMNGTVAEKLTNGPYIILWKIIGEDGHPIEGEVLFAVDMAVNEAVEQPIPEDPAEPIASSSEKQKAPIEQTEDDGVFTVILLIAVTVLVGFGSVLLIKMKR